jgi:toxin ParE1/3/4
MRSPRLTEQAEADLDEVWFHIARDSPANATRFLHRILKQSQLLAEAPRLGRVRADLAPGLRSFPLGNYLIFYRQLDDGIEIVRILHGSRDLTQQF